MKPTRREFVQMSAAAGVGAMFLRRGRAHAAFAMSPALAKFVQPLREFGEGHPGCSPVGVDRYGADYYEIAMRQFTDTLHPDLPPTTLWGYGNTADSTLPAPRRRDHRKVGTPVRVRWSNELPPVHPLPVDMSVVSPYLGVGRTGREPRRAAPARRPRAVDERRRAVHWFSPGGAVKGPSVINWLPDGRHAHGRLLVPEQPERPDDVVPRPRGGHHAPERIRRACDGISADGCRRSRADDDTRNRRRPPGPTGHPGQGVQPDGSLWYPNTYDTEFFAFEPRSSCRFLRRRSCPSSGATQCS